MKLKKKMFLDVLMAAAMVILLFYSWTGGFIHELLGVALILGFLVHVIGNRFYLKVVKNRKKEQWKSWKNVLGLLLNILLVIGIPVMAVSSLCISHDLFGFLNKGIGNYAFWRMLHVICAYSLILVVFGHVLLHWKMIAGFISKHLFPDLRTPVLVDRLVRVLALVMAVVIVKVSVDHVKSSAELFAMQAAYVKKENIQQVGKVDATMKSASKSTHRTEDDGVNVQGIATEKDTTSKKLETEKKTEKTPETMVDETTKIIVEETTKTVVEETTETIVEETTEIIVEETPEIVVEETPEIIVEETPEVVKEPLEDYLGKLFCSGCGRHCSLLAPSCGNGQAQAQAAMEEYNAMP